MPHDQALCAPLFADEETARHFTAEAEIAAMLRVEAALAQAQAECGLIPDSAAVAIAGLAATPPDPAALVAETLRNGVPVPGLLAALRAADARAEETDWLHWGATSQDIIDTALALRLRPVLALWRDRLDLFCRLLGTLARSHAGLPMAARSYGQIATATSFGAIAANWGSPLLRHRDRLAVVEAELSRVSLSGAAGTLAAMGDKGPEVRRRMAVHLGLTDSDESWHSQRDGIAALSGWMAGLAASLGKMGEDVILLMQSGIEEVALAGAGGSSTMPHKENPVAPSALVAICRHIIGLSAILTGSGLHRQERDGAAWYGEWLALPDMCILTSRALLLATGIAGALTPRPERMRATLAAGHGLHLAEALSFLLATRMPRPKAQSAVAELARRVRTEGVDLTELAAQTWPDLDLSALAGAGLGQAPVTARAFANAAGFDPVTQG